MLPTVLLVDDYADTLEMWTLYLRSRGYRVLTAADGQGALDTAIQARPAVIVLDLDLPGISGLEAARRLRATPATADIPLIAATGYSDGTEFEEAKHLGFRSVLVKPCEPVRLVEAIEDALQSAGPSSSHQD